MLFVMESPQAAFGKGIGNEFTDGSTPPPIRRNTSSDLARTSRHTIDNILAISQVPPEWLQSVLKIVFPPIVGTLHSPGIPKNIQQTISKALGFERAWGENSPLTRYATSLLIVNAMVEKHAAIRDRIANIANRNFSEPGQRESALANETTVLATFSPHLSEVTNALERFTQEQWGRWAPLYRHVVQILITKSNTDFTLSRSRGKKISREQIVEALGNGDIERAGMLVDTLFGIAN